MVGSSDPVKVSVWRERFERFKSSGDWAAGFFTLVASVVRNDLDVWAAAHPEAIRQYRQKERRDKADRKQRQRAARQPASTAQQ